MTALVGVFDSGIGGLSILQALRTELPQSRFIYIADSGHAPYGERTDAHVMARSRAIMAELLSRQVQALVIACNTATAVAIEQLRADYPDLPIIGVEPALKPALAISRTGCIGVMATHSTLASAKFKALLASLAGQAEFVLQPCDGLADAIERSAGSNDTSGIQALCTQYTQAMGLFGSLSGQIDTLVLGCTHYPFATEPLREMLGPQVQLVSNGPAVARQTRLKLSQRVLAAAAQPEALETASPLILLSTGDPQVLQVAAQRWLPPLPQLPAEPLFLANKLSV
ncbi:MAG: glutamate racemase [Polaromonas sp.]|nr:glutamate racemase [Polaromonas sp.]